MKDSSRSSDGRHQDCVQAPDSFSKQASAAVMPALADNEEYIKKRLRKNDGLILRRVRVGEAGSRTALLVAISGMVNKDMLNESVISTLMKAKVSEDCGDVLAYLQESVLAVTEIVEESSWETVINRILQGSAAVLLDGEDRALLIRAEDWKIRGIDQPLTETVIRGPRDSFVEDMQTNLSLLRRRIHHQQLRFETQLIGKLTKTKVVLAYIEGVANEDIVREVKARLGRIKVDAILESGYIEQYIEDAPYSLFPTIANTEKPDIAAGRILEGRVAIFVDGTPIVLTVPDLLISHFQVSEDYYSRPFYSSLVRLLRVLSFLTTTMLPGLFMAVQYYHPVLIPYSLLVSLAKAREGVPFQLYTEVIIMILIFEVIREAGIRMPRPIGQAVSIVGALILGQAAVEAGLVGLPVVVVVAFAGISTFLIHSLVEPISILRIIFAVAGATMGIYGLLLVGMVVVAHLASLRSFGIPYAAPLFPLFWKDWKDGILRLPLRMLVHRPKSLRPANYIRLKSGGLKSVGKRSRN